MGLVRILANYVVEMDYAKLPPEVVEQAKRCLLDYTGNLIGGRYTHKGEALVKYASCSNNSSEATVLGYGKVSKEAAAFANAAISRVLDLDDGHRFAMGHPGCILVPAALAVGEFVKASGAEVVSALVAGYEVYARLGAAINPSSYHERGFDATGVSGSVAVAAVAAKLYKFDIEKTKDALGLAALHAGGIIEYQNDGSAGKVLCPGWSTSTGIRAADLANLGFTGPETILEGNKGFFQAFANKYDSNRITNDLGSTYGILQNYFKIYACMRGLHCALDGMLSLRSEYALNKDNVQKITIKTSTFVNRLNKPHPKTMVGAQCSLPFCLAVALKYGCVDEAVLIKGIDNLEISEIEDKIEIIVDNDIQEYAVSNPDNWTAVKLEILTKDKQMVSEWVPVALGEPEKPLSWEQLEAKFAQLIAGTEFEPLAGNVIKAIKQFDKYQTVNEFTSFLKAN